MKDNKVITGLIITIIFLVVAILLVFVFRKNTFTVTFTSDGEIVETVEVKNNSTVSRPKNPQKDGYEFDNWYLDNEIYDFNSKVTKDITLVAKWNIQSNVDAKDEFVVSFDTDGGSSISEIKVESNEVVEKPEDPIKEDYIFVEWQLDGKTYDFSSKITKDITLVAIWKKEENTSTTTSSTTIDIQSITVSSHELSLKTGEYKTLNVTINPSNATNKKVKWSSSNTSVATVDSNGKVTAVSKGSAVITASAGGKSDKCTVTVKENITYSVYWEEVEGSTLGQFKLYIKSSIGNYVSGKVQLTTIGDKTSIVDVPTTGIMYIKSAIKNVTIDSID